MFLFFNLNQCFSPKCHIYLNIYTAFIRFNNIISVIAYYNDDLGVLICNSGQFRVIEVCSHKYYTFHFLRRGVTFLTILALFLVI
jgi:hypothetical protein